MAGEGILLPIAHHRTLHYFPLLREPKTGIPSQSPSPTDTENSAYPKTVFAARPRRACHLHRGDFASFGQVW